MRPGRHGSMSSSELESLITRNGNFLSVRRAGSGDGFAGLFQAVNGHFILGITSGRIPEYSYMQKPTFGCPCTPRGHCRRGIHGTSLQRGWRNILSELVARGRVSPSAEIRRVLGAFELQRIKDYAQEYAPEGNPDPQWDYQQLRSA